MPIITLTLIAVTSIAGAILWGFWGLTGLVAFTALALQFCHDLVSACFEYLALGKLTFIWTGAALASWGVIYASVRGVASYINTRSALTRLPITASGSLNIIEDETAACAFTSGILKPKIYLTRGLLKKLSFSENKAVLLHELHHKKNRDPLSFFALAFLKDALFYLPLAKDFVALQRAKKERQADDSAISAMRDDMSLASALVKVAASGKNLCFANASFSDADPAARIRRILNGKETAHKNPSLKNAVTSLVMAAFVTSALIIPTASGAQLGAKCMKDHCALHKSSPNATGTSTGCKTHCDAPKSEHKH
ncbi:MAG: M56 family metallopeptidase [Deltaproteobacteria bacterium]|nr:M56 family metallopeptidase [Deltaproteobacteria bacterium]